jgi:SAM-dependent methyltransferase
VNQDHIDFLASPAWARMLETDLVPLLEAAGDLGDDVLEIGPGPGLTTDLLSPRLTRLTAVEIDPDLARALRERLAGTGVEVVSGDAASCAFAAGRFSGVTCFSMLHHMPSAEAQDRLFAEVARILRPDGHFVGVDALDLPRIRAGHADDSFTPVDPDGLAGRLEPFGLAVTHVDRQEQQFRFVARAARRPAPATA